MSTNAPKNHSRPQYQSLQLNCFHPPSRDPGMSMEASTWNLYNRYIQIGFSRRKPKIIGYLSNLMQSHWLSFLYNFHGCTQPPQWNVEKRWKNRGMTMNHLLTGLVTVISYRALLEGTTAPVTSPNCPTPEVERWTSSDLGRWCIFSIFRGKKQPVIFC